jgi:hypothetical protein
MIRKKNDVWHKPLGNVDKMVSTTNRSPTWSAENCKEKLFKKTPKRESVGNTVGSQNNFHQRGILGRTFSLMSTVGPERSGALFEESVAENKWECSEALAKHKIKDSCNTEIDWRVHKTTCIAQKEHSTVGFFPFVCGSDATIWLQFGRVRVRIEFPADTRKKN